MDKFQNDVLRDTEAACAAITKWNKLFMEDEVNCQLANEEIQVAEQVMTNLLHIIYTMRHVCTVPDHPTSEIAIARCHREESWTHYDPKFEE